MRLQPLGDEDRSYFLQLYTYLNSRNRAGVVGHLGKEIKDMYILPLPANKRIPKQLLPFNGPG